MDKRGMGGFFGLIGLFVMVLVIATLMPVKYGGVDVENVTRTLNNSEPHFEINETYHPVVKVGCAFGNFMVYSTFEIAKVTTAWAAENLDISLKLILLLIIISVVSPTILVLFKVGVISFLLIKEKRALAKERKLIKGEPKK